MCKIFKIVTTPDIISSLIDHVNAKAAALDHEENISVSGHKTIKPYSPDESMFRYIKLVPKKSKECAIWGCTSAYTWTLRCKTIGGNYSLMLNTGSGEILSSAKHHPETELDVLRWVSEWLFFCTDINITKDRSESIFINPSDKDLNTAWKNRNASCFNIDNIEQQIKDINGDK